jgi:MIP family channel proteins
MNAGIRSWWAEFVGTFALCFIGQGAVCVHYITGSADSGLLQVAVAHGLALATMITALGHISGGHFNPAVTFGFVITGRQSLGAAIGYWVSQLLGAVVASFLLRGFFSTQIWQATRLGAAQISPEINAGSAVLIEAILTFFLVTAVWGSAVDDRAPKLGGFVIGLTVTMDILMAGPLTGGAMNPARAFGPALANGVFADHWVYWVGPLVGGGLAAVVYSRFLLGKR